MDLGSDLEAIAVIRGEGMNGVSVMWLGEELWDVRVLVPWLEMWMKEQLVPGGGVQLDCAQGVLERFTDGAPRDRWQLRLFLFSSAQHPIMEGTIHLKLQSQGQHCVTAG